MKYGLHSTLKVLLEKILRNRKNISLLLIIKLHLEHIQQKVF